MHTPHIFDDQDRHFMVLALNEAETAFSSGNYPVGAVLVIDGELVGQAHNSILTDTQSTSHAEHKLLSRHSPLLRQLARDNESHDICLYSTLEPCMMCLGVAVLHRVSRIIVACPDPHGGATGIHVRDVGRFYREHWPLIQTGLMKEQSLDMIIDFLKTETFLSWETMLEEFTHMKRNWI
jgi:tRNA(adenine34) deaminase